MALESPTDSPKLLLGFPLIGTEDFSFPAIVHSLRFSPTEERDGVYLGQSDDPVNQANQAVLEEACRRLLSIAEFAAASGWSRIHLLAEVPGIRAERWLNEAWLRDCLKTHLVDRIRATPSVLTESDNALVPNATTLPTADTQDAVARLWRLAHALTDLKATLPRQAEAQGWCNAARSWAAVYDCSLGKLKETMDGRDLARYAEAAGSIEELQAQLGDANAVPWLDELLGFLSSNNFGDELRGLRIVPDQNGGFKTLPKLHPMASIGRIPRVLGRGRPRTGSTGNGVCLRIASPLLPGRVAGSPRRGVPRPPPRGQGMERPNALARPVPRLRAGYLPRDRATCRRTLRHRGPWTCPR